MRLNIRVYPGSRRTEVGGRYGEGKTPVLIVRVTAPAVDGRANRMVTEVLAAALGVRPSDVRLVVGPRSRNKVVEVAGVDGSIVNRLLAL
jgi:uncharacterized protein (TIGR00251 family)